MLSDRSLVKVLKMNRITPAVPLEFMMLLLRRHGKTSKKAQLVKALLSKTGDLSLIAKTGDAGEKQLLEVIS